MKRRLLRNDPGRGYVPVQIPVGLEDYADRLRLLNDIPLTYLLTDVSDLPEESIRFGVVDINWTDAFIDGAFSVGRVCGQDGHMDKEHIKSAVKEKLYSETPRMKRMHEAHKKIVLHSAERKQATEDYSVMSAVLIRSELIYTETGLNYLGFNKAGEELLILRIEKIADDIIICLFSGIIDEFIIEEPCTNLKFGCYYDNNKRMIDLRSASDDDFGKKSGSLQLGKDCVDTNGCLHAKQLSAKIEAELIAAGKLDTKKITPARFAYEIISVAHRAKFCAGE
ncbi:hypothetical protein [Ruminococcus albus]|uniref:hypothetical protein n=1 Tax=Ruminococcus albus TaxID=1264 RepID=UPI00046527EB|nr:hypothetical protein [Ruminococcus albus]